MRRKRRNLRGCGASGATLLTAGSIKGIPKGTFPQHGPHQDLRTTQRNTLYGCCPLLVTLCHTACVSSSRNYNFTQTANTARQH